MTSPRIRSSKVSRDANQLGLAIFDQDLGGPTLAVVVAGHHKAVGPCVLEHDEVADLGNGQSPAIDVAPFALREDIARFTEGPADDDVGLRAVGGISRLGGDRDRMVGTVHDRSGQVIEAGIHQGEEVFTHLLDAAHLRDQESAFGDQVSSRFDFQRDPMSEGVAQSVADGIPELKVLCQVDISLVVAIGNRQSTPGADRPWIVRPTSSAARSIASQTCTEVLQVGSRADVHVEPGDRHPGLVGTSKAVIDLGVPNAVLALFPARIGLLAVPVSEAWIDPQGHLGTGTPLAQLADHVGRTAVDRE